MQIKDKIKELRTSKKLTQKQLAEIIGSTPNNVCFWEIGKFEPSIFNCILLADVFGVSLDELCCRDFRKEVQ